MAMAMAEVMMAGRRAVVCSKYRNRSKVGLRRRCTRRSIGSEHCGVCSMLAHMQGWKLEAGPAAAFRDVLMLFVWRTEIARALLTLKHVHEPP